MERLIEMIAVLAALYAAYTLSLQKWDYESEAKRIARRNALKEKGLSNTFYFIHARTLFIFNIFSGGLFAFYWLYRQWQAVLYGFKSSSGRRPAHGPLLHALCGLATFFDLNAIICRTCEYMRQKPPLPPWVWGTVWLGGLAGVLFLSGGVERGISYICFCAAPAVLQRRLNALPKEPISPLPKPAELAAAVGALTTALGLIMLWRVWITPLLGK